MKRWYFYLTSNVFLLVTTASVTIGSTLPPHPQRDHPPRASSHQKNRRLLAQTVNNGEILGIGSTGSRVNELQAMLTLMGYYGGAVDGDYQQSTLDAVRQFQTDANLPADGIAGPITWQRLLPTPTTLNTPAATAPAPTQEAVRETAARETAAPSAIDLPILELEDYGPAVSRLQSRLATLGFYSGSIDGGFGPQTEEAVKDFQHHVGLDADGVVGPVTWRRLLQ